MKPNNKLWEINLSAQEGIMIKNILTIASAWSIEQWR